MYIFIIKPKAVGSHDLNSCKHWIKYFVFAADKYSFQFFKKKIICSVFNITQKKRQDVRVIQNIKLDFDPDAKIFHLDYLLWNSQNSSFSDGGPAQESVQIRPQHVKIKLVPSECSYGSFFVYLLLNILLEHISLIS